MKIAVIGAGLAGLTFAACAAHDGHEVTVFDKNPQVGGVCALAHKNGYSWEQGPMFIGDIWPGEELDRLLQKLGISFELERAQRGIEMPDYKMWFPDEYEGPYWRRDRLKKLFPEDAKGIDEYYRVYDIMMKLRALTDLIRQTDSVRLRIKAMFLFSKLRKYQEMNAKQFTEKLFKNEKIRALFTGILADTCCAPSEFQGIGLPYCNVETSFDKRIPLDVDGLHTGTGFCYIKGGIQKLPEALARVITEHGGKIVLNTIVKKVLIGENERAYGVLLNDGSEVRADVVVGSGGGREMFFDLVGEQYLDTQYLKVLRTYRPMEAVFMIHLGVDYNPLDYMRDSLCYYYKTYDLEEATKRLRAGEYHGGDDGFLIYVPSAHAPEFAPEGKHCVTIYTVAPDTLAKGDWVTDREMYSDKLIELASEYLPDLKNHITEKLIKTAVEYREMTHMAHSAFGGVVPIMGQPNPRHITPVEGLYFVGQQSENAGGIGLVTLGAANAYQKMLKKYGA